MSGPVQLCLEPGSVITVHGWAGDWRIERYRGDAGELDVFGPLGPLGHLHQYMRSVPLARVRAVASHPPKQRPPRAASNT